MVILQAEEEEEEQQQQNGPDKVFLRDKDILTVAKNREKLE